VNAATIAGERGLRVLESHKAKASTGGAGSVLSIFLKSSLEEHMVKGAVLHGDAPRLLHVDGIDVEAPLERSLVYLRNRDVPGVIGKVGTILGEESINIANFRWGGAGLKKTFRKIRTSHARRSPSFMWTGACRRRCSETAEDSGSGTGEGGAAVLIYSRWFSALRERHDAGRGNLRHSWKSPALQAVLGRFARGCRPDRDRRRCVARAAAGGTLETLLKLETPTKFIRGNGESAVLSLLAGKEFSLPEQAREAVQWTAKQLLPEHERALASWPETLRMRFTAWARSCFVMQRREMTRRYSPASRRRSAFCRFFKESTNRW